MAMQLPYSLQLPTAYEDCEKKSCKIATNFLHVGTLSRLAQLVAALGVEHMHALYTWPLRFLLHAFFLYVPCAQFCLHHLCFLQINERLCLPIHVQCCKLLNCVEVVIYNFVYS